MRRADGEIGWGDGCVVGKGDLTASEIKGIEGERFFMIKQELKKLVRERDEILTGTVDAGGVARVMFDVATGEFTHTELDPEVCRREMATKALHVHRGLT